jgi:RimJ/RimL family protein N-acetyltransferase
MTTLHTERLILRPWALDDFDSFAAMHAEPEVMQFIAPDGKPATRFLAWQGFCSTLGHWHLRGFGMFAVIERETGQLVGRAGPWHPEGWPGFEIGWTLRRAFWGRGYATEAARRCFDYAFTELGRDHLISLIEPANVRSVRVAERLGEHVEGNVTLAHVPQKTIVQYGLRRDEWERLR